MNVDHAYAPLGPCEDYEFELVEFIDGASAPERRKHIEHHLETCARCRAFVREMAAVTESLARALPRVELSPGFDAKLQARIAGLASTTGRESARARAEQEYRGALAALRRGLTWRAALNAIASASLCGGLLAAGTSLMPQLHHALEVAHLGSETLSLGIGAVGLIAGSLAALGLARRPWLSLAG